ncbi:hypothetical protein FH972_006584 [Carpinus fangiana]|uniref:Uncharacterized protein n=1 Tax=Carpinus fangiana TaxID=176857 RepID=A0A5N6QT07_9ROSI|nr:hypothetical protein FH972_006584 [Carpinus fangiana]
MDIKVKWIPRKLNQGANRVVNKARKSNIQDNDKKGSDELDETITYQTWIAMYGGSQVIIGKKQGAKNHEIDNAKDICYVFSKYNHDDQTIKKWIDAGTIHYHAKGLEKKDEINTTFWTIIRDIHKLIRSKDIKVKWTPRKLNQTANRVVNKARKSNIQDHEQKGSAEMIMYQTWIAMYEGSQGREKKKRRGSDLRQRSKQAWKLPASKQV